MAIIDLHPVTPDAQPAPAALGSTFTAPYSDGHGSIVLGGVTTDGLFTVEAVDPDGHDPDNIGLYEVGCTLLDGIRVTVASYPDAADLIADPGWAISRLVDESANPARTWLQALDTLERMIRGGLFTLPSSRATARRMVRALHRPTLDGEAIYRCVGTDGVCDGGYLIEIGTRLRHLDACDDCYTEDPAGRYACPRRADGRHPAWTAWASCEPEQVECGHNGCRLGYARVDVEPCLRGRDDCCGCCHGDPEMG